MKRKLSNLNIKNILDTMNSQDFFANDMKCKLPASFRHAYKVNRSILQERFKVYADEHMETLLALEKEGKAKSIGGDRWQLTPEGNKELHELEAAMNEIDLETVDSGVLARIRELDLSIADDEILDIFEEEGK